MRKVRFCPGEYYHVLNRGVGKENIFLDERDWIRFLFLILYLQAPNTIYNISDHVTHFTKHRVFSSLRKNTVALKTIAKERTVELVCFTLMPNHFHLLIREKEPSGISNYLQRVQNAYSKYFNIKYKRSGHVLQGPFRAIHIEDNEQFLYTSAYIHSNPRQLSPWRNKITEYPWSSFMDYTHENRWDILLVRKYLLTQFKKPSDYTRSVLHSGAKLTEEERSLLDF